MQTINRHGWIYQVQEDDSVLLTECPAGGTMQPLPAEVDGHPLTAVEFDAFDGLSPFEAFEIAPEHPAFSVRDGVLFDREGGSLLRYPPHRSGTDYAVPAGTKRIAIGALAGAHSLERVRIPDGVTDIGAYAFDACPALESVRLPASLEKLGHEVFRGCPRLKDVDVPSGHAFLRREGPFLVNSREQLLLTCLPGGRETELIAPEGVKYVDDYAFYRCDALQKIHLHRGLRTLGRYAFYHCAALKTVELPDGLRSIGSRAFSGCDKMRTLFIPDSVTSIEYKAFNRCEHLVLQVNKGSYADRYCRQFGFPCHHRFAWPWQKDS